MHRKNIDPLLDLSYLKPLDGSTQIQLGLADLFKFCFLNNKAVSIGAPTWGLPNKTVSSSPAQHGHGLAVVLAAQQLVDVGVQH